MYKIEKIKYSPQMQKRMFTKHYFRIRKDGNILAEAQTLPLAKKYIVFHKKASKKKNWLGL